LSPTSGRRASRVACSCGRDDLCRRLNQTKFVTIGTGGVTGVYYPTGGSVFNINAVLSGDLDFGVAQSDRQYQAYNGLAEWAESGPQKDLRAVFSIHPESITLIASVESGIMTVADLAGKRVNIGNPGSGQLQNSRDVLAVFGLSESDIIAEQVGAVEAPSLLQDGRIDAFFYTVGHPNGNITEATSGRVQVRIVPIEGPEVDALLDEFSYYAASRIPTTPYSSAANDTRFVNSVGVKATFVTSANVDDDIVYAIAKEVFDNFETFQSLHPAYQVLTKEDMLTGLSAPIHPGALRYYREAGLANLINPALIVE